jgi:hypothetical protein
MTAKGQDRYLFIEELISKKHDCETWANSLVLVIGFFLGTLILFAFLISIVLPFTVFTEKEMFQLAAFFVSDLILFIAAIVKGLEKDKKYTRLKDALKAKAYESDFENADLKADPVLESLFD